MGGAAWELPIKEMVMVETSYRYQRRRDAYRKEDKLNRRPPKWMAVNLQWLQQYGEAPKRCRYGANLSRLCQQCLDNHNHGATQWEPQQVQQRGDSHPVLSVPHSLCRRRMPTPGTLCGGHSEEDTSYATARAARCL